MTTTIFGMELSALWRLISEYRLVGIDPYHYADVLHQNARLREQVNALQEALKERTGGL